MFTNLFRNSKATVVFNTKTVNARHKYDREYVDTYAWGSTESSVWTSFLEWFNTYSRSSQLSQLHKQTKYDLFKLVRPTYNINTYSAEDKHNIYEIARILASESWCDNQLTYLNKAIGLDTSDFSEHIWKLACYYTALESSGISKLLKAFYNAYSKQGLHHRLYWMQDALSTLNHGDKSVFTLFFIQQKGLKLYDMLDGMGYSDKLKIDVLLHESTLSTSTPLPSI